MTLVVKYVDVCEYVHVVGDKKYIITCLEKHYYIYTHNIRFSQRKVLFNILLLADFKTVSKPNTS